MKVKKELLKYLLPTSPEEVRLKGARCELGLDPTDTITVLYVLTHDKDYKISEEAAGSLKALDEVTLLDGLRGNLDGEIIGRLCEIYSEDETVLLMAALNPKTPIDTIKMIASEGPPDAGAVLCENKALLTSDPDIYKLLSDNIHIRFKSLDIAHDILVKEGLLDEKLKCRSEVGSSVMDPRHTLPDDEGEEREGGEAAGGGGAGIETVKADIDVESNKVEQSLFASIQEMSVAQKVKFAITGSKEAREILIKIPNSMIQRSVLKNPRITEGELIRLAESKSTEDELLRDISRLRVTRKSYKLARALVWNPKTPFQISSRLLDRMNLHDIKMLSRSRNISSMLRNAAGKKAKHIG